MEQTPASVVFQPDNVVYLEAYVEKNFWELVNRGHFKDLMHEMDKFVEELENNAEDGFSNPFIGLVPANDDLSQSKIEISLEDLYDDEEHKDLLTTHHEWRSLEINPDDDDLPQD